MTMKICKEIIVNWYTRLDRMLRMATRWFHLTQKECLDIYKDKLESYHTEEDLISKELLLYWEVQDNVAKATKKEIETYEWNLDDIRSLIIEEIYNREYANKSYKKSWLTKQEHIKNTEETIRQKEFRQWSEEYRKKCAMGYTIPDEVSWCTGSSILDWNKKNNHRRLHCGFYTNVTHTPMENEWSYRITSCDIYPPSLHSKIKYSDDNMVTREAINYGNNIMSIMWIWQMNPMIREKTSTKDTEVSREVSKEKQMFGFPKTKKVNNKKRLEFRIPNSQVKWIDYYPIAIYLYCCNIAHLRNIWKIESEWIQRALSVISHTIFPLQIPRYEMLSRQEWHPHIIDIFEEHKNIPLRYFNITKKSLHTKVFAIPYPRISWEDLIRLANRYKEWDINVPWMIWYKTRFIPDPKDTNWIYTPVSKNDLSKWYYAKWLCILNDLHPNWNPVTRYHTLGWMNMEWKLWIVPLGADIITRCCIHPVAMKRNIAKYADAMEYLAALNIDIEKEFQ